MLDMTGLDDGFPVIGEIPKCSDILVCKWPVYVYIPCVYCNRVSLTIIL